MCRPRLFAKTSLHCSARRIGSRNRTDAEKESLRKIGDGDRQTLVEEDLQVHLREGGNVPLVYSAAMQKNVCLAYLCSRSFIRVRMCEK